MPPKKRRQYGSGGISQRKDGLWMGRIGAGTYPNGKRRQVCVYGKTEAEAKAKLERKKKQIAAEGKGIATKTRATVRSWSETWMAQRVQTQRPNSYKADESLMRNWIVPTLGSRRLESLTPSDFDRLSGAIVGSGLTTATARRAHSVLRKMLRAAILEGHDVPVRVLEAEAPATGSNDRTSIAIDEAIAMLAAASTLPHGSRWAAAFLQGLRPSEALGLTWGDGIDFDRGAMLIQWQLQPLPYLDAHDKARGFRVPRGYKTRHLRGQWHLVELKTDAGYRKIPMVPFIHDALLAWREVCPPNEHDLVWPAVNGSPPNPRHDVTEWQALQASASLALGRPVMHPDGERWYSRHEARHTTATLLLELGVDPKVITAIMGHSSMLTTRGYQHVSTDLSLKALEGIAERLQLVGTRVLPQRVD